VQAQTRSLLQPGLQSDLLCASDTMAVSARIIIRIIDAIILYFILHAPKSIEFDVIKIIFNYLCGAARDYILPLRHRAARCFTFA
jgi:hypothetical protein